MSELETSAQITRLETGKTDKELAKEYRQRLEELLVPVCDLMNEASRAGLKLEYNLMLDGFGRWRASPIQVTRPL